MRWHKRPPVWIVMILLLALASLTTQAQSGVPDGAEGQSFYAAFPVTVTVDGNLSEWDRLPHQRVTTGPQVPSDPARGGAMRFSVAADATYLYLAIEVNDAHIVADKHGAEYWFEDSVEVYINATGNRSLTAYQPGVVQLTFPAANIGRPMASTMVIGRRSETIGVHAVVVKTPGGYAVEAAVPLRTSVWDITPTQDKRLGFQIQLNGASELNRDMKLSWSNADKASDQSYLNPSVFGELIFWQVQNQSGGPVIVLPTKPVIVLPTKHVIVLPTSVPTNPVIVLPTLAATRTKNPSAQTREPATTEGAPTVTLTPSATLTPSPTTTPSPTLSPTASPVTPTATKTPTITPTVNMKSNFTVDGSTIYDPNGDVFVVKGTNVNGYNSVWTRKTVSDVDLIDQCWNFNLVRVNSWLFLGQSGYPHHDVNNDLDEIVRTFTERGIVVVFEGHDRIGSYYQGDDLERLIEWFVDLATRYKDNPYVWFDVMNEPGGRNGIDVDQWVNMHGRVVEAIRNTAGADNIIIVEGAFGGQDNLLNTADSVTQSAILLHGDEVINYNGNSFENIVFSIHTYDLWNQGDAKLADFVDQVYAKDFALVIGEYGIQTDQDTRAAAESTFNVTQEKGVGRIVWHWDGDDWNDLTIPGGGWVIDNCANPTNLSWMGQKVWDDNHSTP